MPSKRQYDLVQNDEYDTRIPLHPDEAFHHGINFQVKYIGMLDVPRPTSRVEIVAAMRRIRYEFKAKGIKKKKVTIEVSIDGVKVTLRKKKKRQWPDDKSLILHNPIYRIFYVSHDSQDLKIFSYIARDGASNVFKCAVFKAHKKSQAMRVVRTVGQAFEVCHKLSIGAPEDQDDEQDTTLTQDLLSDRLSDVASDKPKKDLMDDQQSDKNSLSPDEPPKEIESSIKKRLPHLDVLPPPPSKSNSPRKTSPMHAETYSSPHSDAFPCISQSGSATSTLPPPGSALSSHHEIQLLREQLEQQRQQTQAAVAQLQLTRDQLTSEQTARMEAQTRTHQLLVHNRELLDHIAALVAHLQGGDKSEPAHINMPQQPMDNDPAYLLHLPTPTLYENRNATSPLRPPLFNYSSPFLDTPNLERDMIQRLQGLNLYGGGLYNPYVNNYNPYQYNPYATIPRRYNLDHSRLNRHSEPRQMFPTYAPPHEEAYSMPAYTKPPPPKEEPMSHVGISPADEEGRARMTLPIGKGEERDRLGELRLMNGPGVARSASERVPNRSELMSQVQRTTWARHTTK